MNGENGRKSILVIGGGIAGIQASLDLANMGLKVYLVEKSPSIGGRMAQLDKTFPTNDCAMCILAPKMIEASQHPNIELLTYSEVEEVSGEVKNFQVRVRRKATYVDWDKCTGCGECTEACPVSIPSEFDRGLGMRKAIYLPFPQAVPKKDIIDKRGIPPCRSACPAGINAQGYVALISKGKFEEAVDLVREKAPLPLVLGRVCPHFCEDECNRGKIDEPVAIRALKRVCADHELSIGKEPTAVEKTREEKVAIIGSGPAGLSAAYFLVKKGYGATVFEKLPEPGGMLYAGIPEYRLPKDILRKEIEYIKGTGVELRTKTEVGKDITFEELEADYDAVFVAAGAQESTKLGVPGEELQGVINGLSFLRDIKLGKRIRIGNKVAVVGGGNVAIDSARSAVRLGAKEVFIIYRRSREEMPAGKDEIEAGEKEGVEIHYLATPTKVLGKNGKTVGVECIRMELGAPDESGRRRPVPIEGSEFVMDVDTLIPAIGQATDLSFLDRKVKVSRGMIVTSPAYAASKKGVFAGGDNVTGPATVVEAIATGREAAESIDRYLRGEEFEKRAKAARKAKEETKPVPLEEVPLKKIERGERVEMPELPAEERARSFEEVELGLSEEAAIQEAKRCLECGGCSECMECVRTCEAKAVTLDTHNMKDHSLAFGVGAIIVATGLDLYDVSGITEYGYGKIENVITALEYERLTSASGPTLGALERPSDKKVAHNIAFIQCVGSRDFRHEPYCSAVCCMHATKEAMMAYEHEPGTKSTVLYMDMRAVGKRFQEYIARAKKEYNVTYIRSRPGRIEVDPKNDNPIIWYEDTTTGKIQRLEVELVVLAQAMTPQINKELVGILGIELDESGFVRTADKCSQPLDTTTPGIFACGYVHSPRDIPDSVTQASGAAGRAAEVIAGGS